MLGIIWSKDSLQTPVEVNWWLHDWNLRQWIFQFQMKQPVSSWIIILFCWSINVPFFRSLSKPDGFSSLGFRPGWTVMAVMEVQCSIWLFKLSFEGSVLWKSYLWCFNYFSKRNKLQKAHHNLMSLWHNPTWCSGSGIENKTYMNI